MMGDDSTGPGSMEGQQCVLNVWTRREVKEELHRGRSVQWKENGSKQTVVLS